MIRMNVIAALLVTTSAFDQPAGTPNYCRHNTAMS